MLIFGYNIDRYYEPGSAGLTLTDYSKRSFTPRPKNTKDLLSVKVSKSKSCSTKVHRYKIN